MYFCLYNKNSFFTRISKDFISKNMYSLIERLIKYTGSLEII